jgi:putative addiction module component (TIGR02574 family)
MGAFDLQSLLSLSVAQRIELVETLWDSVTVEAKHCLYKSKNAWR